MVAKWNYQWKCQTVLAEDEGMCLVHILIAFMSMVIWDVL